MPRPKPLAKPATDGDDPIRVLITGASGFVGTALSRDLAAKGHSVRRATRREPNSIGEIDGETDWSDALQGIEAVVHLAARVHVMSGDGAESDAEYRRVNLDGTRRLAEAASRAGVARLVFLSTVKVNGEETTTPFTEDDAPAPQDAYGVSKWRAEQALSRIAAATGLETVILRPPLVYGPGVGANFLSLLRIADTPWPLPLGGFDGNARSLLFLGNLVSAVGCALDHRDAAGRTYLVRDGDDVSTAELVRRLRRALGRPARMVRVPAGLVGGLARLAGRGGAVRRAAGSLAVNDGRIRRELGWRPPFTFDQGLAATAAWYRARPNGYDAQL